jgi:Type II secretion system (T2SS), protein G
MPSLDNSKRALYKATYVPIHSDDTNAPKPSRVLEKVAYLRSLHIQPREFAALKERTTSNRLLIPARLDASETSAVSRETSPASADQSISLLDLTHQLVTNISPVATQQNASLLADVSMDDLANLGYTLAEIRRGVADTVKSKVQAIEQHYQQTLRTSPQGTSIASPSGPAMRHQTFSDAAIWAMANNLPAFNDLYALTLTHAPNPTAVAVMHPVSVVASMVNGLANQGTDTSAIVDSFVASWHIEPVGRLHLERLEMTPVGIEHGELLHSVPLTPQETVNITHREWSVTSKTFEDMVQDYFEGFSETGVAEKTDLTQATDTESKHSSALDVNGSVSASYNGGAYSVTASASVGYSTKSEDSKSVKDSQAHSQAITRLSSARTRKDHKISFRVSSVAGAEDLSVRVLTNPSNQNAMRVDYFQLLRKWRVNLIRYGLRMTYDIVIPNPGLDLFGQVRELQRLNEQIAQDYTFTLWPGAITRDSYISYAAGYNTQVDDPPAYPQQITQAMTLTASQDDHWMYSSIDFDVPADYEIESGHIYAHYQSSAGKDDDKRPWFGVLEYGVFQPEVPKGSDVGAYDHDLDAHFIGMSGKVSIGYAYYHVNSGELLITLHLRPRQQIMDAWVLRVWTALRAADLAAYNQRIEQAKDRKTQLESEIAQWDALTLRKMEREEIMKSVLRWLFGPTFDLIPAVIEQLASPVDPLNDPNGLFYLQATGSDQWQTIMQFGEFIKFIHNAIEWENVVFFAYPYFWDVTQNWPLKRFMVHPDPEHQAFLRAGSARVVLTIRPGFEHDFASFIETWSSFKDLPTDHPYVSIGDEIRNFAMTNYEDIPPANPDQNVRLLLYPPQQKAWSEMQVLMKLLEQYSDEQHTANPGLDANVKVYPTTAQGLAALQSLTSDPLPLVDPWGRDYVYSSPGMYGDYDLVCYGANGVPGGTDLDADITSWAEGSVVARWYEYTPTSAMDVSINTVLPTTPQPA